jgi:hypothetical protein
VAHPFPLGSGPPGDERDLRDVAKVLAGPHGCGLFGRATDLADQDDGVRARVLGEELEDLEERRADDRVAPDPNAGRLAEARIGHRLDRLIRQGPGPADNAHPPFAVDRARDDADLGRAR